MDKQFSFQGQYDFKTVSTGLYDSWSSASFFKPQKNKVPFTAILPPPNLTGTLHIGHAFEVSITDQIMRFKRLRGYGVNWIPGFDHAGIATQTKYEKLARETNPEYFQAPRKQKVKMIMDWALTQGDTIQSQIKSLGASLNWNQVNFTLSKKASQIVNDSFIQLFEQGFIYQAETLVNWDTKLNTAISNIEVINKPVDQQLYYIAYKLANNPKKRLVVATTRPETIFVDVCLFVHPKDKHYHSFVKQKVVNPLTGALMPVFTDSYVDKKFGTGVLKCTPAHDFNDFALNEKYRLPFVSCIDHNGLLNEHAKQFAGLTVSAARQQVVEFLQTQKLLVKTMPLTSNVGFSERSDTVVEPLLSKQWFVDLPKLKKALAIKKYPELIPKRFNKQVTRWLSQLKPWCISRQLIWGHPIPVWTHKQSGALHVGSTAPTDKQNYTQSTDVLDTWFSSSLWPLICLDWHKNKHFVPTDLLVTGYDILFFWVLRMTFNSYFQTKQLPFKQVLIHGLVRDAQNRKMSKSLNNGINPMDLIRDYGADATRLFLTSNHTPGDDLIFNEQKLKSAANFLNKLWNVTKYVLQLGEQAKTVPSTHLPSTLSERWIWAKLKQLIVQTTKLLDKYQLALANQALVNFIWNDFCNTFIETIKQEDTALLPQLYTTAKTVLSTAVVMLSTVTPFLAERIYQQFHSGSVMQASWPTAKAVKPPKLFADVVEAVSSLRHYKANNQLVANQNLAVVLSGKAAPVVQNYFHFNWVDLRIEVNKTPGFQIKIVDNAANNLAHLEKQRSFYLAEVQRSQAITTNPAFLKKAPPHKVKAELLKLEEYQKKLAEVNHLIAKLTKAE